MSLISVLIPTYNHAPFVEEAIYSVLSQKDVDIEILIEDDGSSDETANVISSIKDARINFRAKAKNEGACATLNNLIRRASGQFIALLNSDDVWSTDSKLKQQLEILKTNSMLGACFSRASFIDEKSAPLEPSRNFYGAIFEQPNRSQAQWLRQFFLYGNCLCHPSILIRKECFNILGVYDNRFRQVPDYEMWIRLIKKFQIHVFEDPLIKFRILPGENTSAASAENTTRLMNEYSFISENFFNDTSIEMLQSGFKDMLTIKSIPTATHLEIEKALLYLTPNLWLNNVYRLTGLRKIFALLNAPDSRTILSEEYGINDVWLHKQMAVLSPFVPEQVIQYRDPPPSVQKKSTGGILLRYMSFLKK